MKKSMLLNLAVLLALLAATLWFNLDENGPDQLTENPQYADYVLAVSWQPAFCEKLPGLPECRSQRRGRFDASNFTLHGLWPQPRDYVYCDVSQSLVELDKSRRWNELPKLDLSDALRRELAEKMPGYRSGLHRHEWYKHGTCMPGYSEEDYFRISLNMLDELNGSSFREFIERNIGNRIAFRDLQSRFARAFGKEAAQRVIVDCYRDDGRNLIQELKLSIAGVLDRYSDLQAVMIAGDKVGRSCPSGIVDAVGLQ